MALWLDGRGQSVPIESRRLRAWQHGVSLSSYLMRAAYWMTSLSLLAISVVQPGWAEKSRATESA